MADPRSPARWRTPASIAAAVLLVLAAGHTLAWWVISGRVEAAVPGQLDAAAANGWRVQVERTARAGWPWRAGAMLHGVTAATYLGPTAIVVRLPRLEAALSLTAVRHVVMEAPDHATVAADGAPPINLTWGSAHLLAPLDGGPLTVQAREIEAAAPAAPPLRAATLDAVFSAALLDAAITGLAPQPALPPPFDGPAQLRLHMTASPPFPSAATPADAARQWRQAGGRLDVPAVSLQWGPLEVQGKAHGGLDPLLRPAGEGELAARGLPAFLTAAAAAGWIPPAAARAAAAVVGVLSLSARSGPIRVPVSLAEGTLAVAGFPVARLPQPR